MPVQVFGRQMQFCADAGRRPAGSDLTAHHGIPPGEAGFREVISARTGLAAQS